MITDKSEIKIHLNWQIHRQSVNTTYANYHSRQRHVLNGLGSKPSFFGHLFVKRINSIKSVSFKKYLYFLFYSKTHKTARVNFQTTTTLHCKTNYNNLNPWRKSNPLSSVLETDTMTTTHIHT
jgi:hypothetical protein